MKFMWRIAQAPPRAFRRAPELYGADRGFFSEQNVTACVQGAVNTACIPQRGGSKTPQRQVYERWRVQTRPTLSRRHRGAHLGADARRGMKRCRAEGAERFALFVGAAVLANNLMIVAALLTKRSSRRSKPPDKPAPIMGTAGTKPPRLTTSPTATLLAQQNQCENRAYKRSQIYLNHG